MKIKSVRIQNFRSFQDETVLFDDYTCFVGPNGAGKSAVLCALNVFFRETSESPTNLLELQKEDFHRSNTDQPIEITVTFTDLDQAAQDNFAGYYRQGQLVVAAVAKYDARTSKAPVFQVGERRVMKALAPFFEADKEKASAEALRKVYGEIQVTCPGLPAPGSKPKMIEALRQYEESHPDLCELIRSPDQFYGFSKGTNRLAQHIQWVFVPAVKDVSAEQSESKDTALGRLLGRTVRAKVSFDDALRQIRTQAQSSYGAMLDAQQAALNDITDALQARLHEWAHPDAHVRLEWQQDPQRSVQITEPFAQILAGEGPFAGSVSRLGHGLQRAYLLALLHELSHVAATGQPTLVLAVEEPELYQHPPQCRHLANVLQDLASGDSQILLTTHNPYFVSGEAFENVRMVRKDRERSASSVRQVSSDVIRERLSFATGEDPPNKKEGTLAKIQQALQPSANEVFFSPHVVLCEGREDVAYVVTYLALLGRANDLRRVGCHFVALDRKSSLLVPLAILRALEVPNFVVFDSDAHQPDRNGSRAMHRKDNLAILRLCDHEESDPMPTETMWQPDVVMWDADIKSAVERDFDPARLAVIKTRVEASFGHVGGLEKNPMFISEIIHGAWEDGMRSHTLLRLVESIAAHSGA